MAGHLCLKWNNHSSAFLKSISTIQIKERYCDATIACQGKYFPVHRIILSTCSDYFEEMFERMQSPHPYIVFKDIEPREMELLLNYMYQGEVNVVQEMLPSLIKAAEALRIKGLAVPDEMPPTKESGKKRSNTSTENPQPKRRSDESRRRRIESAESNKRTEDSYSNFDSSQQGDHLQSDGSEPRVIKSEPLDTGNYGNDSLPNDDALSSHPSEGQQSIDKEENVFPPPSFPDMDSSSAYIKTENNIPPDESQYSDEPSSWNDFMGTNVMDNLPPPDMGTQDDMRLGGVGGGGRRANSEPLNETPLPQGLLSMPSSLTFSPRGNGGGGGGGGVEGQLQCLYCSYQCGTSAAMRTHVMFRHTKVRPFPCTFCSSRFALKTDLKRHMITHTGDKPHACPKCAKKFIREDHLRKHISNGRCGLYNFGAIQLLPNGE